VNVKEAKKVIKKISTKRIRRSFHIWLHNPYNRTSWTIAEKYIDVGD
jgi:hypothetical protein